MNNKSTFISEIKPEETHEQDETIQQILKNFNQSIPQVTQVPQNIANIPAKYAYANSPLDNFLFNRDIKIAFLLVIVSVVIMVMPIERMVHNYINIESIPYSSIVVKSLFIGFVYLILSHLI